MVNYRQDFETRSTPQTERVRADQVENTAGGFTFALDDWGRLERFLILGVETPTYYAGRRTLVRENALGVLRCLSEDPVRTVATIVMISDEARAPKNDPAIFALAACSSTPEGLAAIPYVCRIGTHLFQYLEFVEGFRGWGRSLRRGVARWYEEMAPAHLAYQVAKYQQRGGWSHWDAIRLSHPKATSPGHAAIYDWLCMRYSEDHVKDAEERGLAVPTREGLPSILSAMEVANREPKNAGDWRLAASLIRSDGLTREMIPTAALKSARVWEVLLEKMPYTAMLRNLGNMSKVGLLKPMSGAEAIIRSTLADPKRIKKSRVHPLAVLTALRIYSQGHGMKGSGEWDPVDTIVDALDAAFYLAFGNVKPTGKRTMLALDVSASMSWEHHRIAGSPFTAREASAAMALVTARTEPNYMMFGFSGTFVPLGISATDSLKDAVQKVSGLPHGRTDCALPMLHALEKGIPIDTFIIYTDNETRCGKVHPYQALARYREKTGIDAKLVVVGMTATEFTIADPTDAGMLDVVGFDSAAPSVIAEFMR